MVAQELDKSRVLGPTPRSQKETKMTTKRFLKGKKKRTIHWTSCTRGSFTTSAELHRLHLRILSPKKTKSLNLNHRRKEGLSLAIQATRSWWSRMFSLWLLNCLFLCRAPMSFRQMTLFYILNETKQVICQYRFLLAPGSIILPIKQGLSPKRLFHPRIFDTLRAFYLIYEQCHASYEIFAHSYYYFQ